MVGYNRMKKNNLKNFAYEKIPTKIIVNNLEYEKCFYLLFSQGFKGCRK
jgi:hypothetical protein